MNLSTLIKITFCLMLFTSLSQAKATWEVPAATDTSKKVTEAAAEAGPQSSEVQSHRPSISNHSKKYLQKQYRKNQYLKKQYPNKQYNIGKRRPKSAKKRRRGKISSFGILAFLIFLSLFILGLLAIFGILALWVLGIFHFLSLLALFGAIFSMNNLRSFFLFIVMMLTIVPLLAVLGLLSFGLTFFSWGAALIGGLTVGTAAVILLIMALSGLLDG